MSNSFSISTMELQVVFLCWISCLIASSEAATGDCAFDNGLCGYTLPNKPDLNWNIRSGASLSKYTGPSTGSGQYLLLKSHFPITRTNEKALLISPVLLDTKYNCVKFRYHMKGHNIRTLNVYTQDLTSKKTLQWSLNGDQNSTLWLNAELPLPSPRKSVKLVFEGVAGNGPMSEIAIDDIKVFNSSSSKVKPSKATPTTPVPTPNSPIPNEKLCGIRHAGSGIVGGKDASPGDWPWQTMMIKHKTKGWVHNDCAGTLISLYWVVTSAICVTHIPKEEYSLYKIRMGAHFKTSTTGKEQDLEIVKIITHPDYNSISYMADNDIALIRLKTPVMINSRRKMACLPNNTIHFPAGTNCTITGWGSLRTSGSLPDKLQQAMIPLVSTSTCTKTGSYLPSDISPRMQCAGYQSKGGVGTCEGDSGSPLVCEKQGRWYLAGVASTLGKDCADPKYPSVFTKVSALKQWIANTMATYKSI